MQNHRIELCVPEEHHLERIDKFLANSLEIDFSRSYVQKLIIGKGILVDGREIKKNYKVKNGDNILISIPEPEELEINPEDIPVDIVYQDDAIAIINKPGGMVVHPGPGNWNHTLVNALLFHLKDLSSIGGVIRPGIVHRLDKDTSGLMVVAKDDKTHRFLVDEFTERRVEKRYVSIVSETPKQETGILDGPIGRHPKYRQKMTILPGGREAVTEYRVEKVWNTNIGTFSKLQIRPKTGRTHQIRVHLSSMGNPVVGDPIYSKKWAKYKVPYLLLGAISLGFTHPKTGEKMDFAIPMPLHIEKFIRRIENL